VIFEQVSTSALIFVYLQVKSEISSFGTAGSFRGMLVPSVAPPTLMSLGLTGQHLLKKSVFTLPLSRRWVPDVK